ncbi:CoA ester lyase [Alkalihalophilus marmarensis]|jgi:citrate lyase subunit beta/citryl-CoA lyase|uniref:HpcH/HpaI aldolase/citrate lyase domain-containing protein n=1 Tax=Alkalihalophilus marmarensis DSM 21297 TaxID=1188261 RepID=U6SKY2_9BACI|nr:CoA ester lyase [Alkalihalophilus marmarensis]ERN51301.1 hypothetical protein A33I_20695 [Alkalihalophilus marmarensis DSM 21297]MCM3491593.1 CoA ester lyase [Alkalihalophilus marmarensis]
MLARSWLFVPGNRMKVIEKAELLDADVIIYDLEDAVLLQDKIQAREMVIEALQSSKKNIFVRMNSLSDMFGHEDVLSLLSNYNKSLKGLILPKVSSAQQIKSLETMLITYEKKYNIHYELEIVPLIESAAGVHFCFDIASASPRVKRLAFGAVDYCLDVNITPTKCGNELLYARSQIVNASRAAEKLQPIDTVYIHFNDYEGLDIEINTAKGLGFGGKLVIHPNQIDEVNKKFAPTEEEVLDAKEILETVEQDGAAVFQLNGRMIDEPIIKKARITLEKYRLIKGENPNLTWEKL